MNPWLVGAGRTGIAVASTSAVLAVAVAAVPPMDALSVVLAVLAVALLSIPLVGAAAVRSAPRNPVSWILLAAGTTLPLAIAAYLYARAVFLDGRDLPVPRLAGWLDGWPWIPAMLVVPTFGILLFPDGRLPSPRWRVLFWFDVALAVALLVSTVFGTHLLDFADEPNPTALPGAWGDVAGGLGLSILLVAPASLASALAFESRVRHTHEPTERSALVSVRPAVWLIAASWWACIVLGVVGGDTVNALPVEAVGMVALGGACWVAVRRHGLFDARLVLRRGIVYAALTGCVALVYAGAAGLLAALGVGHLSTPLAVGIGIAAALPLRDVLQRAANRLLFGLRDDPFATFVRLGDQLEATAAPDDVLPTATLSVRQALRLQYVAVRVGEEVIADSGSSGSEPVEELPLVYAGEAIGTLVVQPVDGDSPLGNDRTALLSGIARHVAAAARATALSRDLVASRERLVAATEEERLRLRRDLHDGLGPALSSAVLGISRARALVDRQPDAAGAQLDQLTRQIQDAVAEVRRLVYGLRPPALDELGLVGALDEQARLLGAGPVVAPREPLGLSAAVEVAAYRIAMEAMTNATRHARAGSVTVDVSLNEGLHLEIADDGVGMPELYRAGVGISSMRERAAELGGSCTVEQREPRGTVVRAVLPLGRT